MQWARRRPAWAALLVLSTLVTVVGFPGVTWLWLRSEEAQQAKEAERQRADEEAQEALRQAYRGSLAAAVASFNDHDVSDAAQYLQAAPAALRNWEWRHLFSRLDDSLATVRFPETAAIGLCPAGSGIVTAENHQVRLWDALTGASLGTLTDDCSNHLFVTPTAKGSVLLVENRAQTEWRLYPPPLTMGSPGRVLPLSLGREVALLAADADANRIAALLPRPEQTSRYFLSVFELADGHRRQDFKNHTSHHQNFALNPDGTRLAAAAGNGGVDIWDTVTGQRVVSLEGHSQTVEALMFRADGKRLLTGSSDRTVRQWDANTGQLLDVRRGHKDSVYAVAYSPDGRWLASAGMDRTVRLWNVDEPSEPVVLLGHTAAVRELTFSPDSRRLASLGEDQTARVWDLVPRQEVCRLRSKAEWLKPVAYSPDGTLIASTGGDQTVRLWDAATGETLAVLPHSIWVSCLAFSPDGAWLVAGEWEGTIRIWDTATGQLQDAWTWQEAPAMVRGVAVSPDGTRIVAAYENPQRRMKTRVLDRKTGQIVGLLQGQTSGVFLGVAYRPDGRQIATADQDGAVCLWDARTYEPMAIWRGHTKAVNSVAYSADGRSLLSASEDNTIRLWDVATGDCRAILRGHVGSVYTAVFHPDRTRIVSAGRDGFLRFWDVTTAEEVAHFPGHTSWVWSLASSPDGRTLVSGSADTTLRLWDTAPQARRLQARQESAAQRPEAERLVDRLFAEQREPRQVVQALRTDSQLNDALRREALRVVLRRSMARPRP